VVQAWPFSDSPMATLMNTIRKTVFSSTLPEAEPQRLGLQSATTYADGSVTLAYTATDILPSV
jgi:hypothetical protein